MHVVALFDGHREYCEIPWCGDCTCLDLVRRSVKNIEGRIYELGVDEFCCIFFDFSLQFVSTVLPEQLHKTCVSSESHLAFVVQWKLCREGITSVASLYHSNTPSMSSLALPSAHVEKEEHLSNKSSPRKRGRDENPESVVRNVVKAEDVEAVNKKLSLGIALPPPELLCPNCRLLPCEPVFVRCCGAVLCRTCTSQMVCPMCDEELSNTDVIWSSRRWEQLGEYIHLFSVLNASLETPVLSAKPSSGLLQTPESSPKLPPPTPIRFGFRPNPKALASRV